MFRVDDPSAVASMPALLAAGVPGFFGRGDPGNGVRPTVLTVDWANIVQEELVAIVAAAGISLDKPDLNQVLDALRVLFNSGRLRQIQSFVGGNSGTIALATETQFVRCIMVGGGGGGGGTEATAVGDSAAAGGGASGSYAEFGCARAYLHGQAYSVGTGGAGGVGMANGTTGGATTAGAASAPGGGGGGLSFSTNVPSVGARGAAGASGSASGAVIIASARGAPGESGLILEPSLVAGQVSGSGGSGPWGGGGHSESDGPGGAGDGFGSGGGGAASAQSRAARNGGAGSGGRLILVEYT